MPATITITESKNLSKSKKQLQKSQLVVLDITRMNNFSRLILKVDNGIPASRDGKQHSGGSHSKMTFLT